MTNKELAKIVNDLSQQVARLQHQVKALQDAGPPQSEAPASKARSIDETLPKQIADLKEIVKGQNDALKNITETNKIQTDSISIIASAIRVLTGDHDELQSKLKDLQ